MSKLDYDFKNVQLLQRAKTHSYKSDQNYESLEFIGDGI